MASKCCTGGRVDRGGELEVEVAAATPDMLDTGTGCVQRWTLPMPTSNTPRRPKALNGLGLGLMFG